MVRYLVAAGLGAALVYFLDPNSGTHRREAAAKELASMLQHSNNNINDVARHTANTAQELSERTAKLEISRAALADSAAIGSFPYTSHTYDTQSY